MPFFRRKPPEELPARRLTGEDVALAYRLILGREPDEGGLRHYGEQADRGLSLPMLLETLLASDEYRQRASSSSAQPTESGPGLVERQVEHPLEAPASAADLLDPVDVIQRHSLEELNATAEEYHRRVPDPTPLMSKPFSYLHEAPQMLHDLGLLLGGLHLGKGMTVLDFGAGTCWLSRLLAQLNCAPICCDVSASALAIGQRLFADHPLIGTTVYQPTFLHFDGRHLDLPDASVDRIVCFDAFHHIPNQEEVMAQFGRVLKDGGVAAFSEPGREHSRSPQSQYEMRHHHVLENDIDLNAIFRMAQTVGFTDMSVHVLSDLSLSLEEYNVVFGQRRDEALRDRAWDHMHDAMFNRSVFFLRKGDLHRDSRSHDGLAHRLTVDRQDVTTAVGVPVGLTFTIENAGTATWIHEGREIFGLVRLASHLAEADGRLLSIDYTRHALPVAVQPGEQVSLTVDVPMPGPGRYLLTFDLVAEGVTWFENVGCTAIEVRVAVV